MSATVPLWEHVLVVVVMLAAHGVTFHVMNKSNRGLRDALEMRDILLGETESATEVQTYKDISPAVAAYSVAKMLTRAAPLLKLDKFGQTYKVEKK